jgi:hypothetical protein
MAATYIAGTTVWKIRLLIPDRDVSDPIFQDDELTQFYETEGNERYAAALALEIAAINDVMVFKVMKAGADSIDAVKGAALLLERATRLRTQEPIASFVGQFGVIEQAHGVFGTREVIWNRIRRATL